MSEAHPDPLHHFSLVRTSDPEELRQLGTRWLGADRLDLRNIGGLQARLNAVELETIALGFGATSCDLVADTFAADFVRLQIALKGRGLACVGRQVTDINERQHAVTSAGVSWQMVCQGGHERLTLRIKQEPLLRRLAALVDVKPRADYEFEGAIAADDPQARGLVRLLKFLAWQLDENPSGFAPAVYRELEDAVQIAFLSTSRHKFRDLIAAPGQMPDFGLVKRLEDFIEANWREAMTIERLVAESGLSARSLFRAFERVRGYSPIAYAKSVRLRRAREMLLTGDPAITVASAAAACNFVNPGHFARYYRETYGELPSATLARSPR
ncbi:AraC family transcriptional regulator [Bradyrhizobium sp. SZCCHNR2026]|uniref:AraC family transcriptional regulator n=1 Tax=Bradyrhizobium sp. SZCCHNR2026 TaxID=3057381 RepID=UPI002916EDC1|nr:AraC family transcriptional regulator [Bradyrhizobium sp. SZCCHNR2026]